MELGEKRRLPPRSIVVGMGHPVSAPAPVLFGEEVAEDRAEDNEQDVPARGSEGRLAHPDEGEPGEPGAEQSSAHDRPSRWVGRADVVDLVRSHAVEEVDEPHPEGEVEDDRPGDHMHDVEHGVGDREADIIAQHDQGEDQCAEAEA